MKLKNYEARMVHDGKRNNREVRIVCKQCNAKKWVRWQRVRKGQGRFCSLKCANKYQREQAEPNRGKENARFHWDKTKQCWCAYWREPKTGKLRSTTRARWLWEMNIGEIPSKYVVTYKDGNSQNCILENLELISRAEWNKIHLIGHRVSDETKTKLSKAHKGKILSKQHKRKIGRSVKQRWESGGFEKVHVGEHHRRWKGGLDPYPREFNDALRSIIRKRDNHKCRCCNKNLYRSRYGHVHHIDGDKQNNKPENLVLVCATCHGAIHDTNSFVERIIKFRSVLL